MNSVWKQNKRNKKWVSEGCNNNQRACFWTSQVFYSCSIMLDKNLFLRIHEIKKRKKELLKLRLRVRVCMIIHQSENGSASSSRAGRVFRNGFVRKYFGPLVPSTIICGKYRLHPSSCTIVAKLVRIGEWFYVEL